jgi:signal recognition particle GTPase
MSREIILFVITIAGRSEAARNVHWTITRPVNDLFTGRQSELAKIETAISQSAKEPVVAQQMRFVIAGLGGQGKSEICLKIANSLREK